MTSNIKHPATYSEDFIPVFAELLLGCNNVLDPMAGVGKIAKVKDFGYTGKVYCNELEPEWKDSSYLVDEWHFGDAANMEWAKDKNFDAICTSPTYGNRMADHHNAKDDSKRITYTHRLGRKLDKENTGYMQWGRDYQIKHIYIYIELIRVLKKNGILIINCSNHIRKGEEVDVVSWHKNQIIELGLEFIKEIKIPTRRMKFGANSNLRTNCEYILLFKKSSKHGY